jgi:hypothetical protein
MKKLILSATFLVAGTMFVMAQGQVQMSNAPWEAWTDPTADRLVYLPDGTTPVSDPTWAAQLQENQAGVWTDLGAPAFFFGPGLDGIWADDGVKRIVSVGAGVQTELRVNILDGAGAVLVSSEPFTFTMGTSVPPGPADVLMQNLPRIVVPEPSTIALGVLGLGALLLFRRRK